MTLAKLFGGTLEYGQTAENGRIEVLTHRADIRIVIDGPGATSYRMVLRGGGEEFHVCDGSRFLEPRARMGQTCGCAGTFHERKAAAQVGRAPRPDIRLMFSLADAPEMGTFDLTSSSWDFAESLPSVLRRLRARTGPPACVLRMEAVRFTTLSGIEVGYQRPALVVDVQGDDAVGVELSKAA